MSYLRFVLGNSRFLSLGVLLALCSSFGQTYYIAVFGADLRVAFDLSDGGFGSLYAAATLISGLCLIWAGRQIDRVRLLPASLTATAVLALGCVLMAVAWHVAILGLALLLLRFAGQGVMGLLSATAMARRFDRERGRAIGVASLGFQAGLASFPALGVGLALWLGWRGAWWAGALALVFGVAPLIWLLIGRSRRRSGADIKAEAPSANPEDWTRARVLRDPRFYAIMPVIISPPFILTGVVFHQVRLVEQKGWALDAFALGYPANAAAAVIATLLVGSLADRAGAARLLPYYTLPMVLGLVAVWGGGDIAFGWLFLLLAGFTGGAQIVLIGSLWPELYGVTHLGAIKSMASSAMILSTAASPPIMGWLVDRGVSVADQALGLAGLSVLAATGTLAVRKCGPRPPATKPAAG